MKKLEYLDVDMTIIQLYDANSASNTTPSGGEDDSEFTPA